MTPQGQAAPYLFRHLPEHFKVTTRPEAQPSLQWKEQFVDSQQVAVGRAGVTHAGLGAWVSRGKPGYRAPAAFSPCFCLGSS